MTNSVKIALIISSAVVIAALLISRWMPLQNASLELNEISAIKINIEGR